MYLHEAIIQVLRENGHEMKTQEVADEINRQRLYAKKDRTEVTAFQIHGRAKNYPQLFTRKGSLVGIVE
ncbi:MAG: HTH domain-containing protein [Planctomycetota bacterium]|nr:HTH domain-containing protein [Planctomycetota bacterium]